MVILWLAHGYGLYTHKEKKSVFNNLDDAKQFTQGLTDSQIYLFSGKNTLKAVNDLLSSMDFTYKARG